MRILHLVNKYSPHIGGVEKHVSEVAHLQKSNNTIYIVTEKYTKTLIDNENYSGINIIRITRINDSLFLKKFSIWFWMIKNIKFINSFDIIHVHDVFYWLYPVYFFLKKKNTVLTLHGWEGSYPIPKRSILQKKINVKLASATVSVGDFINKWFGIKTDRVTYGGVRINLSEKKVKLEPNTLLFLGRLEKDTGLDQCINMYHKLKNKLKWNLAVIGDGNLKNQLTKDITYLGVQKNPQDYIHNAKWIFTTGYLGILEALSLGKPIICSYDNPVKEDYLKLHPMSKYFCFDDNIPDHLSHHATEWAKKQSWENITDMYEKIYFKLLSR